MRPEVVDLRIRHPVHHQQPLYCFVNAKKHFVKHVSSQFYLYYTNLDILSGWLRLHS
jgi:hypothetical protein